MAPGFFAVLSETGNKVSLDEFHDWYDNEHIPLRLNHLPYFLSGARYQSIDGIKPSWIAAYEIQDTKMFQDKSYTILRETRSQREADLVDRLGVLDRRMCQVVKEVSGEAEGSNRTTGLKMGNPSRWVVTHRIGGISNKEEEVVVKWLNEVVAALEKDSSIGGWVNTRLLKVLESTKMGLDVGTEQDVLSYFVFHEFVSKESANSPTFRQVIEKSDSSLQISEFRRWELYKSYPGVAQGNL